MNKKDYTKLTFEGKDNLLRGTFTNSKTAQPPLSQKENKFLQHFKTINNIDPLTNIYNRQGPVGETNQKLYMSKLQSYSQSKISQIQRIIRSNEDENNIRQSKNDFKIQPAVPTIHAKPQIKRNLQRINSFFNTQDPALSVQERKQQQQLFQTDILQIGVYSEIIKLLPSKKKEESKPQVPQFYSIYNTPTQRPLYEPNTQQSSVEGYAFNRFANSTETQRNPFTTPNRFTNISLTQNIPQTQSSKVAQSQIKIRKADMLLVEILREKKRKGLVNDYYKIMELKLFELLDFILQDQQEFQGLSSIEKMKQVLKNLESFKGKKIQGENKINLLKIFFEQFRNLKNEIAQSQKKKPLQKVQNKQKPPVHKQIAQRQVKQVQKKTIQEQNWSKKTPIKQTMSLGGNKKQKTVNQPLNRSVKGMEDQWLGELQ